MSGSHAMAANAAILAMLAGSGVVISGSGDDDTLSIRPTLRVPFHDEPPRIPLPRYRTLRNDRDRMEAAEAKRARKNAKRATQTNPGVGHE